MLLMILHVTVHYNDPFLSEITSFLSVKVSTAT